MNLRFITTIFMGVSVANAQSLVAEVSVSTLCGLNQTVTNTLTCAPTPNDGWYVPCAETCSDLKQALLNPYFDNANCTHAWTHVANLITETRNLTETEIMHYDMANATSLAECESNTAEWFVSTGRDCAGTFNGTAAQDACGVCAGNGSTCADCAGTPNGNEIVDDCGVCGGDDSSCADCEGTPNGNAVLDVCGVCDGDD